MIRAICPCHFQSVHIQMSLPQVYFKHHTFFPQLNAECKQLCRMLHTIENVFITRKRVLQERSYIEVVEIKKTH